MVPAASSLRAEAVLRAAVEAASLRAEAARPQAGVEGPLPVEVAAPQVELAAPVVREGPAVPEAAAVLGDLAVLWSATIRADSRCLSPMDSILTAYPRAHFRDL